MKMSKPVKLVLSLPPDSHPSVISRRYAERESVVGVAVEAMEAGYSVFGTINELAGQVRDKARLAQQALPHVERAASKFGRAIDALRARRDALDKQLTEKIVGDGRDHVGGEIRAHLKSLKAAAVLKVADAARLGDRRTVAAALSAPAYLSGLDEKQQETLRGVVRQALEPDLTGVLADLDANLARVERANTVFLEKTAASIRAWRSQDDELIGKALGGAA
jgi:hypothetical protein